MSSELFLGPFEMLFLAASGARPALMIALLFLLFLFLLAFSSFSHLSLKVFLCRAMAYFVPSRGT
jgi:hypothetical protein